MQPHPTRQESLAKLDSLWTHINRRVAAEVRRETEEAGDIPLTGLQMYTLRILRKEGALTMSALADSLGVSQSSANGVAERLVETGLVVRERDDEDRRIVRVALTRAGIERLSRGEERRVRVLARYFSVLDAGELAEFVRLFERVDRHIAEED